MTTASITTVQIWKSETETIVLPVLGVFSTPDAAQQNAYAVALKALTENAPQLVECPVTATVTELSDEAIRAFLAELRRTRPDLLPTPRGKAT